MHAERTHICAGKIRTTRINIYDTSTKYAYEIMHKLVERTQRHIRADAGER